jgi:AcrR family transcriptional regulator
MDSQTKLLDSALNLFSQRGYEAVSVQDVVEAASLTKPTLYHFFGSKRGLLDALLTREANPLIESVKQSAFYQGDLVLTLERVARAYFKAACGSGEFYRMCLAMQYSPPESESYLAMHPYMQNQQYTLEYTFLQAVKDHGNLAGRHKRYAAGFFGQINAAIGLYFEGELTLGEQSVYLFVHQFMHGILS